VRLFGAESVRVSGAKDAEMSVIRFCTICGKQIENSSVASFECSLECDAIYKKQLSEYTNDILEKLLPKALEIVGCKTLKDYQDKKDIAAAESFKKESGYVYFIQANGGPIKIGWSTNPEGRLAALQTATHERLEILKVIPGSIQLETELHHRFMGLHKHGEWYEDKEELIEFISTV
jgi:predicted nucleic acid-binding Zn ribbon protein